MIRLSLTVITCFTVLLCKAQVSWLNADAAFNLSVPGVHVFESKGQFDGAPFRAFYVIAPAKSKALRIETDTALRRRLTASQFYAKNDSPLLVINSTFFSFASNSSLNLVIKNGGIKAYNHDVLPQKGKDTLTYKHPFASAFGINPGGKPDIAWTFTDSSMANVYASQQPVKPVKDSINDLSFSAAIGIAKSQGARLQKWKMKEAAGGGPVLVQNGQVHIYNNEEMKFSGKAINDKHPRTLVGYTKHGDVIFMAIEGRNAGLAEGATLTQCAILMQQLGCVEAMNLDGGGSSCMLVNGKETIKPSDKTGERPVPAVFIVKG